MFPHGLKIKALCIFDFHLNIVPHYVVHLVNKWQLAQELFSLDNFYLKKDWQGHFVVSDTETRLPLATGAPGVPVSSGYPLSGRVGARGRQPARERPLGKPECGGEGRSSQVTDRPGWPKPRRPIRETGLGEHSAGGRMGERGKNFQQGWPNSRCNAPFKMTFQAITRPCHRSFSKTDRITMEAPFQA